ncbi:MAG: hypothetical protein ACRDDX_13445 [Cellulosilyticaceae bacterium]
MKRLLTTIVLLITSLSLTACGGGSYGKTEPIEDAALLARMNETIAQATTQYFDIEIPTDVSFKHEAFKSLIPSPENPKEFIHHSNIFQAAMTTDPVEGQLSAYGGVLSPDSQTIMGLILNVYNEKTPPQSLSDEEIQKIATDFLKAKELVASEEKLTFLATNKEASSEYVKILNFDSETNRFAVGVNLQFGKVVYFEFAPLSLFEQQ